MAAFFMVDRMRLLAIALLVLLAMPAWATSYINPMFEIYFDLNSAVPRDGSSKAIEAFLKHFNEQPNRRIMIQGHSDWSGPDDFNFDLSRRRAEAIRDVLMKRGIPLHAMKVEWWGEQRPMVVGTPNQPIPYNRRVSIWLE